MELILLILIIVAIWYYFAKYRPKKEQEKEEQIRVMNQRRVEAQRQAREDELFSQLRNGQFYKNICEILETFRAMKADSKFGMFKRVDISLCSASQLEKGQQLAGSIKMIVDRYSGDVSTLLIGCLPNPRATPDNFAPKYIQPNYGEMYDYFTLSNPTFSQVLFNMEVFLSKRDDEEIEWRRFLYLLHDGMESFYADNGIHFFNLEDRMLKEIRDQFSDLKIMRQTFERNLENFDD